MNFTSQLNLQYFYTNMIPFNMTTQPTAPEGFYLKTLSPTLAGCTTNLPTQILQCKAIISFYATFDVR